MIIVEGTSRVRDIGPAREAMLEMISASRAEQGCIEYAYSVDIIDPQLIRVTERWTDREALIAHLASSPIARWRASWSEIGASERSLRLYEAEPETF